MIFINDLDGTSYINFYRFKFPLSRYYYLYKTDITKANEPRKRQNNIKVSLSMNEVIYCNQSSTLEG